MHTAALALFLLMPPPSVTTMAAVAVFAANVDRQWPADEREPVVTGEALRLMTAAARALADDDKVNDGKLKASIERVDSARDVFLAQPRDDVKRPESLRDALRDGSEMLKQLAAALHHDDDAIKRRVAAIKRSADGFDKKQPVVKQIDTLERYFKEASEVMKSLLEAESTAGTTTSNQ